MGWHEERERLLADTIAFVHQVTGDSLILAVKSKAVLTPEIEMAARHYRRYHAAPKPTQLAELRLELDALSVALRDIQPIVTRACEANYQTAIAS